MLFMLAVVALSGFAILAAGSTTSSLHVKDFGSAFFVAAAMTAAGWPLSMPIQMAETSLIELLTGSAGPSLQLTGWWLFSWSWLVFAGFTFAENFILFLAIILMTLIDLFVPLALVNVAGPFVAY